MLGDSGAGGVFICCSISPDLELCWRTHNKHLARAAVLGWAGLAGLVLGSFTYRRSIWSFIKPGTRTRLGSRLTLGPASCRHQITSRASFVFVQSSFSQVLSSPGPADDVTSWPALAAAPSSQLQLWGCDDDDSAGTHPQSNGEVATLALVTTLGHCSCRTEDWAGLGSDHTTSSL